MNSMVTCSQSELAHPAPSSAHAGVRLAFLTRYPLREIVSDVAMVVAVLAFVLSLRRIARKAELFAFFQAHPEVAGGVPCQRALRAHLPRMMQEPAWRGRTERLPPKYRSAILAAEIGAAMVYRTPFVPDFGAALVQYVEREF